MPGEGRWDLTWRLKG